MGSVGEVGQATAIGGPVDATAFPDGVEGLAQVGDAVGNAGAWDNQAFRIYNLKRRKKRQAEPVPEGRWDITVTGPQAEVHADETPTLEPVEVAPPIKRDHSRWIVVQEPKPLRVKARVVAVKPVENDEWDALRLLLLLAS